MSEEGWTVTIYKMATNCQDHRDTHQYNPTSADVQSLITDDSYSVSGVQAPLLQPNRHIERLSTPQRLLQYSILLFEVFRSTASEAYTLWIPISMQLSQSFFADDTTDHNAFMSYQLR